MFPTLAQVAFGGAIGASARFLTGLGVARLAGVAFPWGTLVINVAGSFAMGALVLMLPHLSASRLSPFLLTGVLGGFTTFSAFSLDTVSLWERGEILPAVLYAAASVGLSLMALALGMALVRSLT